MKKSTDKNDLCEAPKFNLIQSTDCFKMNMEKLEKISALILANNAKIEKLQFENKCFQNCYGTICRNEMNYGFAWDSVFENLLGEKVPQESKDWDLFKANFLPWKKMTKEDEKSVSFISVTETELSSNSAVAECCFIMNTSSPGRGNGTVLRTETQRFFIQRRTTIVSIGCVLRSIILEI